MKVAVFVVLILAVAAALYFNSAQTKEHIADMSATPNPNTPLWDQKIPPGSELVEGRTAKINAIPVRQNMGSKAMLEFHITEEHGYMVDGIQLRFGYRFKDPESGYWIEDPKTVTYWVKDRLEFNETLVAKTVLMDIEFEHLGIDLAATTDENWQVEVIEYSRAMKPT